MNWKRIYDYILASFGSGREMPEPQVILDVCNEAIRQMPGPPYAWTSTTPLENALYVPIPSSLQEITGVVLFGETLFRTTLNAYNETNPDWQNELDPSPVSFAVRGHSIYFGGIVPSIPAGDLRIRGIGYIPPFSMDPAEPNPFDYINQKFWMLPAYYAVAFIPRSSGRLSKQDVADEKETVSTNRALWFKGLDEMKFDRMGEVYRF